MIAFGYISFSARAGVQECDTDCQVRHTKCVERCEQDTPCALRCGEEAERCVKRCREKRPIDGGSEKEASRVDSNEEEGGEATNEAGD
jgi:hypothetical protein